MARFKVDLERARTVTADTRQPGNEARRVGSARSGVAFLQLFQVQPTGTVTFRIDTASSWNLGDDYWPAAGSVVVGNSAPGVQTIRLTNLGTFVKWRVDGVTSAFTFSCVVFLSDQ